MHLLRKGILAILSLMACTTLAQQSQVFSCSFQDDLRGASTVRMKKYFSETEKMTLGKIDLLTNQEVTSSSATKVYEFPVWDSQDYVQVWYAKDVRVDATLNYSQSRREFAATLTRENAQHRLLCREQQ
jgi:hypothetical protein